MATGWPQQVWDPQNPNADVMGMVGFTPPMDAGEAYIRRKHLTPEIYQEYKHDVSDPGLTAWDAIENPFFKGMYEMRGGDWETLRTKFYDEIGTYENQAFQIMVSPGGTSNIRTGRNTSETEQYPAEYKNFDSYQAALDWIYSNPEDRYGRDYDFNESDIQLVAQPPPAPERSPGWRGIVEEMDERMDKDDSRFWGINNAKWEGIFNDMASDGNNVVKNYKLQEAPIIREGPRASDYGIMDAPNDNIFTAYGLDKPHTGPEELQWNNYKWNLKRTWTSNVTYAVPPGLKRVDLHGDTSSWQPRTSLQEDVPTGPA